MLGVRRLGRSCVLVEAAAAPFLPLSRAGSFPNNIGSMLFTRTRSKAFPCSHDMANWAGGGCSTFHNCPWAKQVGLYRDFARTKGDFTFPAFRQWKPSEMDPLPKLDNGYFSPSSCNKVRNVLTRKGSLVFPQCLGTNYN